MFLSKKKHFIFILENKQQKTNDIFENQFTYLDKQFTEIPVELTSAMSIVLHLRDTYHGILQSRRTILFDIILYLSDKAKKQVQNTDKNFSFRFIFFFLILIA